MAPQPPFLFLHRNPWPVAHILFGACQGVEQRGLTAVGALEEVVARNYLIREMPDAILNIVDGTNIERNLYLTTQLIELGLPVVVAVTALP